MRRLTGMLAFVLLAGCPTPPEQPPQPLKIGVKEAGAAGTPVFRELLPGDATPIVLGPNGLNMVVPSLRAEGIDPRAPDPTVTITVGGVLMAADIEGSKVDMQADGTGYVLWDLRVPFQLELCCYNCLTGKLDARIKDASDAVFEGSVNILMARGECPDPAVCCASADFCPDPDTTPVCQ